MTRRKGVTLVEIMVVISIILVLMAMVALVAGPALARSKTQPACASNLRQLAAHCSMYMQEWDEKYPSGSFFDAANHSLYDPHLAAIDRCPLTRNSADPSWGRYIQTLYLPGPNANGKVVADTLPDGSPIPTFDPERDVLFRCLDHAYGGFSRGDTAVGRHVYNSVGTVLGVRLDGSAGHVAPDSCWQYRYDPWNGVMSRFPNLLRNCDRNAP